MIDGVIDGVIQNYSSRMHLWCIYGFKGDGALPLGRA